MNSVLLVFLVVIFGASCSSADTQSSPTPNDAGGFDDGPNVVDMNMAKVDLGTDLANPKLDMDNPDQDGPLRPRIVDPDTRELGPTDVVECDCPNPNDVCSPLYFCVLGDQLCDAQDTCPNGYDCRDRDRLCANVVDTEERPTCLVDNDCPFFFDCFDGRCVYGADCSYALQCEPGQVCGQMFGLSRKVCQEPGPKGGGESCQTGYECASGTCQEGTCLTPCLNNADCPGMKYCLSNGVCSTFESPMDRALCGDEITTKYTVDECASGLCRVNADCVEGCVEGYCVDEPPRVDCKDNEYVAFTNPGRCEVNSVCQNDSQCEPPYTCYSHNCSRLAN